MKILDKEIKEVVDVCHPDCVSGKRPCYWPRPDPGVFTPGKGYKTRGSKVCNDYICGYRNVHGCPDEYCQTTNKSIQCCQECSIVNIHQPCEACSNYITTKRMD